MSVIEIEDLGIRRGAAALQGVSLRVGEGESVAVVGDDFPEAHLDALRHRAVDLSGLERVPGRTFRWRGRYGADFGVPKFLRVEWRDKIEKEPDGALKRGLPSRAYYGGTILGNYTVPVASRIPESLLEDRRRNGGGFRLKIRIHPDGPLIGWDLERGVGTGPDGSKFHHAGGDFQEAYIYNGKVLRRGWYIHPKTGQRFETDY